MIEHRIAGIGDDPLEFAVIVHGEFVLCASPEHARDIVDTVPEAVFMRRWSGLVETWPDGRRRWQYVYRGSENRSPQNQQRPSPP